MSIQQHKVDKKELTRLMVEYMAVKNLSQRELAELLDITTATLSRWLSPDGHGITLKNAERIKWVCGLPKQIKQINTNHSTVINNVSCNNTTTTNLEQYKSRLIQEIIMLDIDTQAKDLVLRTISNFKG